MMRIECYHFSRACPIVPAPFVKKTILSLWVILALVQINCLCMCVFSPLDYPVPLIDILT
jgi:hypothetical protein